MPPSMASARPPAYNRGPVTSVESCPVSEAMMLWPWTIRSPPSRSRTPTATRSPPESANAYRAVSLTQHSHHFPSSSPASTWRTASLIRSTLSPHRRYSVVSVDEVDDRAAVGTTVEKVAQDGQPGSAPAPSAIGVEQLRAAKRPNEGLYVSVDVTDDKVHMPNLDE